MKKDHLFIEFNGEYILPANMVIDYEKRDKNIAKMLLSSPFKENREWAERILKKVDYNENKSMNKDPENCPLCQAEKTGNTFGWGFSPEGWEIVKREHSEKHCDKCSCCGQDLISIRNS